MTPKQVTHVRMCQNVSENAAYSSTTIEDQHVNTNNFLVKNVTTSIQPEILVEC